ncbi:MAG: succinate dehydrogenase, cytochrome b556 subunit [Alphaproteobacteria bacterium]
MTHPRPLSPHLQVYKPQITSVLSIFHRGTGIALAAGGVLLAYWFVAIAQGAEEYAYLMSHLTSWYGVVALWGWMFSFYYHLSNGIRHLWWDAGRGFELEEVYRTGWMVVASSVILTTITAFLTCGCFGDLL